jgi:hypothetical protein
MRRRRVIIGLVVLTVVGGAMVALWPRGPRPCRSTFELVQEGMTRGEVIATVGGPPGDYSGGLSWWGGYGTKFLDYEGWLEPDAQLMVRFDADGRADRVAIVSCMRYPSEPDFWQRIRARLGL